MIDHYKGAKNNLLKISTIVMISDIYSMKKEYSVALDWLKKGEKIQTNPYFENLLQIEKAQSVIKTRKKRMSQKIFCHHYLKRRILIKDINS